MPVTGLERPGLDRARLVGWYAQNRERSRRIFDAIEPAAYYSRPIALRNPIVFYEGHLPAFSAIAFLKRGLGHPGVDGRLEELFARGIDPETIQDAVPRSGARTSWPPRDEVLAFAAAVDRAVMSALRDAPFDLEGAEHAAMRGGEAVFTALEHEAMHQETLLYMWHRLPYEQKRKPAGLTYEIDAAPPAGRAAAIPAGRATLGARRADGVFGWDNEFEAHVVDVPAFEIDVCNVTNAEFLEFVEDGGYARRDLWTAEGRDWVAVEGVTHPAFWLHSDGRWWWRGMFEPIPLPAAWPVYVSHAEATAFARWRGRRLPTEAEFHRAAFGTPDGGERPYPWGAGEPDASRGHFDFHGWEPVPVGSRPRGASAWGVEDLVGNGWEWTSTVFGPFEGFQPMPSYPEYSADFFDGRHFVMKGGSQATATPLLRRSFRNWFRANYPFVYATFRTVAS